MALIAEALPKDGVAFCQEHGLEGVHLDGHQLTHDSARTVLDAGLALRCYTINDMSDAERLVALGVSMIMTDFPERFCSRIEGSVGQGAQIPVSSGTASSQLVRHTSRDTGPTGTGARSKPAGNQSAALPAHRVSAR